MFQPIEQYEQGHQQYWISLACEMICVSQLSNMSRDTYNTGINALNFDLFQWIEQYAMCRELYIIGINALYFNLFQ